MLELDPLMHFYTFFSYLSRFTLSLLYSLIPFTSRISYLKKTLFFIHALTVYFNAIIGYFTYRDRPRYLVLY